MTAVVAMPAMAGWMWTVLVVCSLAAIGLLAQSADILPQGAVWTRLIVTAGAVLLAVLVLTQTTSAWYYDPTAYCVMNGWWDIWTC